MSLTLAIAINVVLSAALLGVFAWAVSRAGKLTPHEPKHPRLQVIALHDGARVVAEAPQRRAA
jgi:hypothetical protein